MAWISENDVAYGIRDKYVPLFSLDYSVRFVHSNLRSRSIGVNLVMERVFPFIFNFPTEIEHLLRRAQHWFVLSSSPSSASNSNAFDQPTFCWKQAKTTQPSSMHVQFTLVTMVCFLLSFVAKIANKSAIILHSLLVWFMRNSI